LPDIEAPLTESKDSPPRSQIFFNHLKKQKKPKARHEARP
jgi:hypothetical protein